VQRRAVAAAIALVIGSVSFFGSLTWAAIGMYQVATSPDPKAELANRPVLR
jgi:hypothetical protein